MILFEHALLALLAALTFRATATFLVLVFAIFLLVA